MTRNILDLTKKPTLSSNNLLATNASLNHLSEFKGTNSHPNRARKPLPIIEPRTGKEINLESDPIQKNLQPVPAVYIPNIPSQPISPTKNMRKPLPIINPKTGEIVTNPALPPSPQKRAIPIINPKTGTELDTSSPNHERVNSDQTSSANIIRTPFMVMINRPQLIAKKAPNVLHSTYPMSNSQIPLPPSRQTIGKQSPILHSDYPNNIWSKARQPHEWPLSSHSDLHSGLLYPFQDIEDEEEESEVDKYDWTPCLGSGMSFFDDDESGSRDQQVTVW
jgi:hypothetical protein